ncbi:hypothetical protein [Lentilactobacillus sunkii]|jgi:hypothetical protein|uniref:Uncharacterized protein n=1 Tax=Lentilactobacillus sunkii DSM 19904 TaxID=1423808 RepID=A0A0R1L592_9LACO|nr:hypothetical protein [Lentilactobacillus sunkii]KRK87530.1 hypothetical protein FD17_GL000928 [Lentilactobacillus sunkii DSM 19904]
MIQEIHSFRHKVQGNDHWMTDEEFREYNQKHPIADESILKFIIDLTAKHKENHGKRDAG